jgi:photosystem II PsbW protein
LNLRNQNKSSKTLLAKYLEKHHRTMFASTLNASTFVRDSKITTRKSTNCFKKAPQAKASETFDSVQKKSAAISATIMATIAPVFPALAIVDDRLNGDGTGLPLGINDGALGIVLGAVPLGIFALYFTAGKQDANIIAGGKDDESGLSL